MIVIASVATTVICYFSGVVVVAIVNGIGIKVNKVHDSPGREIPLFYISASGQRKETGVAGALACCIFCCCTCGSLPAAFNVAIFSIVLFIDKCGIR